MDKRKIVKFVFIITLLLAMLAVCVWYKPVNTVNMKLSMKTTSNIEENDAYKIYYLENDGDSYSEEQTSYCDVVAGRQNKIKFSVPANASNIRLDVGMHEGTITINGIVLQIGNQKYNVTDKELQKYTSFDGIESLEIENNGLNIIVNSDDPYVIWNLKTYNLQNIASKIVEMFNIIIKGLICLGLGFLIIWFRKYFDILIEFPADVYHSKKLLFDLSKNDFKTKYAGSYLGIVWAFIQPIVTVLVYWFVFEKGLKSGGVSEVPFVLWLIAGLVPWFFFSDAWNGGTGALIEYQYLVKKIVFQINILPIVKVLSALYVHLFFVVFTLFLYICYGYMPDLYTLQIVYYTFAAFIMVLGLCYITSAIVCFFKDLTQIIGIILQVGVWMTPIMWNIDGMDIPQWLKYIFEMNPMYYIVTGYRDSLINKVWFWERTGLTIYFWIFTLFILGLGMVIFKKLKVHFADVL